MFQLFCIKTGGVWLNIRQTSLFYATQVNSFNQKADEGGFTAGLMRKTALDLAWCV